LKGKHKHIMELIEKKNIENDNSNQDFQHTFDNSVLIRQLIGLGFLRDDGKSFNKQNDRTYIQTQVYPFTEKGYDFISMGHYQRWIRDLMTIVGFFAGTTLVVWKIIELSK